MGEFIAQGGIFGLIVVTMGVATFGLNLVQLIRPGRDLRGTIAGMSVATLAMGVAGTAVGLYLAGSAIAGADAAGVPDRLIAESTEPVIMLAKAIGIASTTTALGALFTALNAIIAGVGHSLRSRG